MNTRINCRGKVLELNTPQVMAILNVTPDSFYDGGWYNNQAKATERAAVMLSEGADIIDVGGESTRPGALAVSEQEEIDRVVPVIRAITKELNAIVSIDTSSAAVMKAAVDAGASMINDVRALQRPGALQIAASLDVPVVLMHSLVEQTQSDYEHSYQNLVADISNYLDGRIQACIRAGIKKEQIIIDPGFGGGMFGKTSEQNIQLVRNFHVFHDLQLPLLAGVSRKGFLGKVSDKAIEHCLPAALAVQTLLLNSGVHIIRTHDVAASKSAIKIVNAVRN